MKRKTIVRWGIVVALIAVHAVFIWWRYRRGGEAPSYRTVTVERGALKVGVPTTGTVQPQNRLEIKAPIAGRVEEILVDEGQGVRKGQILAWLSSTERAALLDTARAQGTNELARWERLYRPTPLTAPLDGTLIARHTDPGQTITAQDALFVLSDRLIVEAQVDETDIGRIAVGQRADLTLDAYPHDPFTATVDRIAYEAKTVNNVTTYTVEILPARAPDFMRSGMTANIQVIVAVTNAVLLVPSEAVHTENRHTVVWQPTPNGKGVLTNRVTVSLSDGRQTVVTDGLSEGDAVLVRGLPKSDRASPARANPFAPFGRPRR